MMNKEDDGDKKKMMIKKGGDAKGFDTIKINKLKQIKENVMC